MRDEHEDEEVHGCLAGLMQYIGMVFYVIGGMVVFANLVSAIAPNWVGTVVGYLALPLGLVTAHYLMYGALFLELVWRFGRYLVRLVLGRRPRLGEVFDDGTDDRPRVEPSSSSFDDGSDYKYMPWRYVVLFVVGHQPVFFASALLAWFAGSELSFVSTVALICGAGLVWTGCGAVAARLGWVVLPG